jgi:hypothetical protein
MEQEEGKGKCRWREEEEEDIEIKSTGWRMYGGREVPQVVGSRTICPLPCHVVRSVPVKGKGGETWVMYNG